MSEEKLIFAAADREGDYYGEHLVEDLDYELSNLEYADVVDGEYQVWKYPSGEVYELKADREVEDNDHYSTPNSSKGEVWRPLLAYIRTDKQLVSAAYNLLKISGTDG